MSSLDDRFIAYVCDNGPLITADITQRVGGTREQADAIVRFVSGNSKLARGRYDRPITHPDGRIEIRSRGHWRDPFLTRKGYPSAVRADPATPQSPARFASPVSPRHTAGKPTAHAAGELVGLYAEFEALYREHWPA